MTYVFTNVVDKVAWQQFDGASSQRLLLPLDAEHEQLLLLLLAEGLTVTHLGRKATHHQIHAFIKDFFSFHGIRTFHFIPLAQIHWHVCFAANKRL